MREHCHETTEFPSRILMRDGDLKRRSGIERRRFRYDVHIPERRGHGDRRNGSDRESLISKAASQYWKSGIENLLIR